MKVPESPLALADRDEPEITSTELRIRPAVLLIGRRTFWGPFLTATLQEMGCAVHFQNTAHERPPDRLAEFDLILGGQGCRREIHRLPNLAGSRATVFYVFPVEDSCWWLPALKQGIDCFGSAALRPAEFSAQLKHILARHAQAQIA